MADILSKSERRSLMQKIRRYNTDPEQILLRQLSVVRYKLEQHPPKLPGRPDIWIPALNIAVFVHGCFWHGHKTCAKGLNVPKSNTQYWIEKIARNRRRDRRVSDKLRKEGIAVYTIWQCELGKQIPLRLQKALIDAAI